MDPSDAVELVKNIEAGTVSWDTTYENTVLWAGVSDSFLQTSEGARLTLERAASPSDAGTPLFTPNTTPPHASLLPVRQGAFPDCFFCAAAATLGETVIEKLFLTKQKTKTGVYAVQFYAGGRYVAVVVDDIIPKSPEKKRSAYASSPLGPSVIWPSILEKAYAKFYNGFKHIVGGNLAEALHDLGGGVPVLRESDLLCEAYLCGKVKELPFIVAGTPSKEASKGTFLTPNHAYVAIPHIVQTDKGNKVYFKLLNPLQNKGRNSSHSVFFNATTSVPEKLKKTPFFSQTEYILGKDENTRKEAVNTVKYVNLKEFTALFEGVHFGLKSLTHCRVNDSRHISIPLQFTPGRNGGGPMYCSFRANHVYKLAFPTEGLKGACFGKLFVTVEQEERRGVQEQISYPLIGVTVVSTPSEATTTPVQLCPGRYRREGLVTGSGPPVPYAFYNTRTASYDLSPIVSQALLEARDVFLVVSTPTPGATFPFNLAFLSSIPNLRISSVEDRLSIYRESKISGRWCKKGAKPSTAEPNLHPSSGISSFHRNAQYKLSCETPGSQTSIYLTLKQDAAPGVGKPPSDVKGLHQVTLLAYAAASGVGEKGYGSSRKLSPATAAFSNQTELVLEVKGITPADFPITLVPCPHKDNQESRYLLTAYSEENLSLSRISPAEVRKNGTPPQEEELSLSQSGIGMGASFRSQLSNSMSASMSSSQRGPALGSSQRRPTTPKTGTKSASFPAKPATATKTVRKPVAKKTVTRGPASMAEMYADL